MAALPHTPYAVLWFSIASLSDLPGDIRRDLSMCCTCLPGGSGEYNREVQIHVGCAFICLCLVLILCQKFGS
jgi:hypothetical protein